MDYRKGYMSAASLADRIRENAAQGKSTTARTGLASKPDNSIGYQLPDLESIRAKYMVDIQDMFAFSGDKVAGQGQVQTYLDTLKPDYSVENLSAPSASSEGHTDNSLLSQLIYSESGGDPNATRINKDGRRFSGLVQMGEARLEDYNKANNATLKLDDFKGNPDIERSVISWHIRDLTTLAEELSAKTGMDVNGLVAVGHLGGRTGMANFATTGGKYNKRDELGTSLMDYYTRFKSK
jgi:hypothetical protein